jgi:hypothetical protein
MNWNKNSKSVLMKVVIALVITAFANSLEVHADGPSFPPKFDQKSLDTMRTLYQAVDLAPEFVPAASPVDGAFGFKLGDVFDPKKPEWGAVRVSGTDLECYVLQAPKPIKQFSHYAVWISEGTNKIYMIVAGGFYDDQEDAMRRFTVVSEALGKKYGPRPLNIRQPWLRSKKLIMNVSPKPQEGKWAHFVMYFDLAVEPDGQVEKELEEIDLDAL